MDILLCFITAFVRSIHWFNPFTCFLFKELKLQQEFIADSAVMRKLNQDEQKAYGGLIVHMLSAGYSATLKNSTKQNYFGIVICILWIKT